MMKRTLSILLAVLAVMTAAGCAPSAAPAATGAANTVTYPDPIAYEDYEAQFARRDENPVADATKDAVSAFAYQSAATLLDGTENANYAPASLYYAAALLALGASGTTADELNTLLGTDDPAALAGQLGNLMRRLDRENDAETLHIANALWLRRDVTFAQTFLDTAAQELYASAFSVDMEDPKTAELMKQWVYERTNGKIERDFTLSPELVMSVMNTVYFKGAWMDEFDAADTADAPFTTADGRSVTASFMKKVRDEGSYRQGEDFAAVRLPFAQGSEMVFVLPDEGTDLAALCADPAALERLFTGGEDTMADLTLRLPKFKVESEFDLLPALSKLGVNAALDAQQADFSKMTAQQVYVSAAAQQTYIAIDEKGAEAAAVTVIKTAGAALLPELPKVELTFDRPFLFGLYGEGGVPLFLGVVCDPVG